TARPVRFRSSRNRTNIATSNISCLMSRMACRSRDPERGHEHDPDAKGRISAKWQPVFPRDKRGTRLRGDHARIEHKEFGTGDGVVHGRRLSCAGRVRGRLQGAFAAAEAAQKQADGLRNKWTTTEARLAAAKKAAGAGDFDAATTAAREAEALAKASIFQATSEKERWKDMEIR